MTGPSPEGLDDVRRALRERGYLQGPLQRFVLRDAGDRERGAARPSRAAFRGALLGAPLLAALLAWAAALANRPLHGPFDGIVLWLYFLPVAGLALFVADLLATGVVRVLVRVRGVRRGDSLRAGLLVGVPVLAYLVVLWWTRPPGAGLVVDLAFLALAALLTLVVSWLAGLVSVAAIVRGTGSVPRPAGTAAWLALAAVSLAGMLAVGLRGGRVEPTLPAPDFDVAASSSPLVLVGIDGLESTTIAAFEPRGVVDGMLATMAGGAVFPLSRRDEAEPAEVWTTAMSGVGPERHGVRSVGVERLPGVATPLSPGAGPMPIAAALRWLLPTTTTPSDASARSVLTLWEIVALRRPSVAVGWWSSWPAVVPDGTASAAYVVSDRVLPKLLGTAEPDRDTVPASLFGRLAGEFAADRQVLRERFDAGVPAGIEGELRRWLWESFLIDAWNWTVARRLGTAATDGAVFVYLPGLDILRHRLAEQRGGGLERLLSEQAAIEWYVGFLDGVLREAGRWRDSRGGHLVVIADPGRSGAPESEGFVAIVGPAAEPACVAPPVERVDTAPLALALLGFPGSLEMQGRVPEACLSAASERTVAGYGRRPAQRGGPESDWDDEMLERLRSLGYLN